MNSIKKRSDISDQRRYKIVKNNDLIRKAKYSLSAAEIKTLSFIFSKIKPTDTPDQEYTISIREYCMVCGNDYKSGANYNAIRNTLKKLRDTSFWILREDGKEETVGWLQKLIWDKHRECATIRLDDTLQKYVIGLASNFTSYELLPVLSMSSAYSIRIFEWLRSFAYVGQVTIDLEQLKAQIGANYKNFKDFRVRILEKACKEINEYSDINVIWAPIREGKKVVELNFKINMKDIQGISIAKLKAETEIEGQINIFDYYL